jgi:mono/diheme cytochrome c family protein
MMHSIRQRSLRIRLGIAALAPVFLLFVLLLAFPPDGVERGEWMQFIGRFHLLVIHLPIAFLLLVPVLELAQKHSPNSDFEFVIELVWGVAILGAIVAAGLGWSLARSGGYSGYLMTQHMWGAAWFSAVCCACWLLRGATNRYGTVYAISLAAAILLLLWIGYRGGQLSLGENLLTEHMPESARSLFGITPPQANLVSTNPGPSTFYGARIQPLFSGHCITCHGPSRHKGNLRLDSYAALLRGGKHGAVIKAGEPNRSELFHRITLPPTDDSFMPAENKRPLSAAEVKLMERWIAAGASPTLAADAIAGLPSDSGASTQVAEVTFAEIDPAAVARERSVASAALAQLQKRFPNTLEYESRGSADLTVNMSLLGSKFGDPELAAFQPLAEYIVVADFSNTAITDRSATMIASMKHLRVLKLVHTNIGDTTVQALGSLEQLQSLSLFGTRVTSDSLPVIERLPKLQHIYAGETNIPGNTPIPDAMKGKILF